MKKIKVKGKYTPIIREYVGKYSNDISMDIQLDDIKLWDGALYKDELQKDGTFQEVFLGNNKVMIAGLMDIGLALYDIPFQITVPSLEDKLYTSVESVTDFRPNITINPEKKRIITCFNISTDGAQGGTTIYSNRYTTGIDLDQWVPFLTVPMVSNNFGLYLQKYMHFRVVVINGEQFVEYFSKKCNITYSLTFTDGTMVPNNPEDMNPPTDRDCRLVAQFPVIIDRDEMVQHFRHKRAGGAQASQFNSIMLMMGSPATIRIGQNDFSVLGNTHVFAKCNHATIPHGADGTTQLRYKIMHI